MKAGDKIYSFKKIVFGESKDILSGKEYIIEYIDNKQFSVKNERGNNHFFSLNKKKHHYYKKWFKEKNEYLRYLRKKKLEKIMVGSYYMVVFLNEKNEIIEMEVLYVSPYRTVESTAKNYAREQGFAYSLIKSKFNRNEVKSK
jgi:hypothetical protein